MCVLFKPLKEERIEQDALSSLLTHCAAQTPPTSLVIRLQRGSPVGGPSSLPWALAVSLSSLLELLPTDR